MFNKVMKLSAPIAGAILLVSAGFATTAAAAPRSGDLQTRAAQAELVVKADHRRGNGRRDWNGHRGGRHHVMGPRQIRRSLRHRGFHKVQILDRRGPVYIVKARAWGGQKMRLVVDSRTAHIVRSSPMGHRPRWQGHWQGRWH